MPDELLEKYVRDTLEHLKTHADQSVFSYTRSSAFSDGIMHAVRVIESALEAVHTEEFYDPTDPAKEIE